MASVIVIPVQRKKGPGWKVQWRQGGGKQRSETFDVQQDAKDFAAIKKGDLVSGKAFDAQPGRIKFHTYWEDEYLQHWFPKLSVKTQPSYAGYYRRLLLPYFGDIALKDIRKRTLRDWSKWAQREAQSAHSIKESFVVLRSVLTRAVNAN